MDWEEDFLVQDLTVRKDPTLLWGLIGPLRGRGYKFLGGIKFSLQFRVSISFEVSNWRKLLRASNRKFRDGHVY